MKNRSYRYDISKSRSRHGHKYTKYKISLVIMMVICIKLHPNEKSVACKKSLQFERHFYWEID